jgi:excinuclease UvrABC ATPase subunit
VLFSGTPEQLSRVKKSHTGRFLAEILGTGVAGTELRATG